MTYDILWSSVYLGEAFTSNLASKPTKSQNGSGWSGAKPVGLNFHCVLELPGKLFKLTIPKLHIQGFWFNCSRGIDWELVFLKCIPGVSNMQSEFRNTVKGDISYAVYFLMNGLILALGPLPVIKHPEGNLHLVILAEDQISAMLLGTFIWLCSSWWPSFDFVAIKLIFPFLHLYLIGFSLGLALGVVIAAALSCL